MATGDVVFTSSALEVVSAATEGTKQTTALGSALVSGSRATEVDLVHKLSSAANNPFDVTKTYVVEVKEA
jgi:hypothetical protein